MKSGGNLKGVAELGHRYRDADSPDVEELDDLTAVYGVSSQAIRVPGDYPVGLALPDARHHLNEDRAARGLGATALGERLLHR